MTNAGAPKSSVCGVLTARAERTESAALLCPACLPPGLPAWVPPASSARVHGRCALRCSAGIRLGHDRVAEPGWCVPGQHARPGLGKQPVQALLQPMVTAAGGREVARAGAPALAVGPGMVLITPPGGLPAAWEAAGLVSRFDERPERVGDPVAGDLLPVRTGVMSRRSDADAPGGADRSTKRGGEYRPEAGLTSPFGLGYGPGLLHQGQRDREGHPRHQATRSHCGLVKRRPCCVNMAGPGARHARDAERGACPANHDYPPLAVSFGDGSRRQGTRDLRGHRADPAECSGLADQPGQRAPRHAEVRFPVAARSARNTRFRGAPGTCAVVRVSALSAGRGRPRRPAGCAPRCGDVTWQRERRPRRWRPVQWR